MQRYHLTFRVLYILIFPTLIPINCNIVSELKVEEIFLTVSSKNIKIKNSDGVDFQYCVITQNIEIKNSNEVFVINELLYDSAIIQYDIIFHNNKITLSNCDDKIKLDKMANKYKYLLKSDILILISSSDTLAYSKNYLDYITPQKVILSISDTTIVSENMIKFLGLVKRCEILDCRNKKNYQFRSNGNYFTVY